MKKYSTVFLSILLMLMFSASCTQDDDNFTSSELINPPQWIQGKWEDGYTSIYFSFTKDNIITQSGGMSISYKEMLTKDTYSQTSSNSDFSFTIKPGYGISNTYKFRRKDNNTILCNLGIYEDDEIDSWDYYYRK